MGSAVVWTAAKVITSLRSTIGDPSGATVERWTADELDDAFNRAALQVCLDADYALETTWCATLVEDQREYAAPENFFKAESVRYLAGSTEDRADVRELRHLSFQEYRHWYMRDEDDSSEPEAYYLWTKRGQDADAVQHPVSLWLHPTPNATAAAANAGADNLEIFGYKYPDSIDSTNNDTLTVELPPHMVEAAIMYAASVIFEDDDEVGRARQLLLRYEGQVEKFLAHTARRDRSGYSRTMPRGSRRSHRLVPTRGLPRW